MATIGDLVATLADVEGIGRERVMAIACALRQDGLIATRGRGSSAAEMSEADAANLLIAVNVVETASGAEDAVRRYRRLRAGSETRGPELGSELEKILSGVSAGSVSEFMTGFERVEPLSWSYDWDAYEARDYQFEIRFQRPTPGVYISVRPNVDERWHDMRFYERASKPYARPDRTVAVDITMRTISAVGKILRGRT